MLPEIKHILYTTDLGDDTRPVFRYAISLAQHYHAQITVLHILEPLNSFGNALLETYMPKTTSAQLHQKAVENIRLKMQKRLEAFCAEELHLTATESHLIANVIVVEGEPSSTIVNQAKQYEADMIVMGTHSYSPINEMFIGSTARKVTQMATIPVLVVPMKKKQ